MVYTRLKAKGSYTRADWEKFCSVISTHYSKLGLTMFKGNADPPIPQKHSFALNHWPSSGNKLGFIHLITLYVDTEWNKFEFKFFDKHDDSRKLEIKIDCIDKNIEFLGSYDNKFKLLESLQEIKKTFEFNKDLYFVEYINGKDIFIIYGRNIKVKNEIFKFLKAIGLKPIEWIEAISKTREGSPYIGKILDTSLNRAQAFLALLTPDEFVRLKPEFINNNDSYHEKEEAQQARPNVIFEAGMAFGRYPERTIIVEFGDLRPFSDIFGRHTLRMDNSQEKRTDLISRLETAGCEINKEYNNWLKIGDFELDKNP